MKRLEEIRQVRLDCVKLVADICPKKCVLSVPPGLWCWMCQAAKDKEVILAWVSDEASMFEGAIGETVAELRKASTEGAP